MAHPWNKICLVSAIALAGAVFFFAGCNQNDMDQLYRDLINATRAKNGCSCSYFQFGQQQYVSYSYEQSGGNCTALQQSLTKTYGAASKATCWAN